MYSANSLSFGAARNRYGPVPDVPRRIRRAFERWFRAIRQALILRALDALVTVCRAVRPPVASDYDWRADTNVYPFDTQTFHTPGQVLKAAADKQLIQEDKMVIRCPFDASPATPLVTQRPASASPVYVSKSPTPGLPNTISTKETARILAEARANNSPFLIGSSKRWTN